MSCLAWVFITLASTAGCATTSAVDSSYLLVAERTIAFDRRPWIGKGSLFPWLSEQGTEPDGSGYINVATGCFVDVTYETKTVQDHINSTDRKGRETVVTRPTGHWCHAGDVIVDVPTLLHIRKWRSKLFVEDVARIHKDDQMRFLVVDSNFIESAHLSSLKVALGQDPRSGTCYPKRELTPDYTQSLNDEAPLIETPEGACFAQGVYLRDLPSAGSNTASEP